MRSLFICGLLGIALFLDKPREPTAALAQAPPNEPKLDLRLPVQPKSVRFAVIGDNGTGAKPQYEIGQKMDRYRQQFPFDFVVMLGDNIYGGNSPSDYKRKFEEPYKALLDAGVKFFASLGNHDNPNERFYKLFNMGGKRYYTFKEGNVAFFALDSNYMDPEQLTWLENQLSESKSDWKICYFHHPLYSDGKFHGSDVDLRARLEPMFVAHGVNVVLSGHDHMYERIVPQRGVYYFVLGSSGELRMGDLIASPRMAKGFDRDRTFALFEIAGDQLYFQVISRDGSTVDTGNIPRQTKQGVRLQSGPSLAAAAAVN